MTPDTNLLEQWVREETLVRIVFVDGEELVSKDYIRASPLDCFISHVFAGDIWIREGGDMWMFRFKPATDRLSRPVCPVVTSITPIEG
jgi:hypothetical protein